MAVRESSYQGKWSIPVPRGIDQSAGDTNTAADCAYRAQNIRTERGLLASAYGTSRAFPALGAPIRTLTRFYRRTRPDDPDVFVAAAGGAIYTYTLGTEGWIQRAEGFRSDMWSYVTYETAENGETVDILILSNAQDGMIAVYGSDLRVEKKPLAIGDEYGDVRFAVLGRYAERIWGTGAPGYSDHVFYSRPYNPFDWTGMPDTPQLGGGVIGQPTWDGESFLALHTFGGYLLAIKPSTVFEIRGTDPSCFTISEAYGTDGPLQARTVCTDRTNMLFLAQSGLGLYDGTTLRLLSRDALHDTMRMRADNAQELATACICNHVYYLALCVRQKEGDVIAENNTVIEYDTERGTLMLRTGIRVKDFFAVGGRVYYTDAASPYEVMRYNDPQAAGYVQGTMECSWVTPWLDLIKERKKSDFVLRFTAEADEEGVPLEVTVSTERGEKTRTVLLGKARRDYRVKVQLTGMRMRLGIHSQTRNAGWRIYGGIQIEYTHDER